jgi:hypothetical protein
MHQITLKNILTRLTIIFLSCIATWHAYAADPLFPEQFRCFTCYLDDFSEAQSSINTFLTDYAELSNQLNATTDESNLQAIGENIVNISKNRLSPLFRTLATNLETLNLLGIPDSAEFTSLKTRLEKLTEEYESFLNTLESSDSQSLFSKTKEYYATYSKNLSELYHGFGYYFALYIKSHPDCEDAEKYYGFEL